MKGRYKSMTPVTDFSVSQRIRVALIDAGHTDLAIDQITTPVRELEEKHGYLERRIMALEQEKVKFQTESGVLRIIENRANLTTATLTNKALVGLIGVVLTAAGAVLSHWIWKTK